MITKQQRQAAVARAIDYFNKAHIVITPKERQEIEVADFGLSNLDTTGLELITYVNTERVCAKELILFPKQTCPEHRHPSIDEKPGKEETFRCRWGKVYLYVSGEPTPNIMATIPKGHEEYYTVFHEIILNPGEQYTIFPDTLHWFQAGEEGTVVSEFSTRSTDEADIFTDSQIQRFTIVND